MSLAAVIATVIALTRLVFVFGGPAATANPQAAVAWVTGANGTAPATAATADAGHHPVLEIAGFGSWCCGQDRALARALPGTVVQQFSYLGTDRRGQSLPYGAKASNLPLPKLGDRIAAQLWRLHEETGKPVDIVAESEGTCPLPHNVVVIPAFHGELLGDPVALGTVRRFLTGSPVSGVPGLRSTAEIMAGAATAWRMPESAAPSPPCGSLSRGAPPARRQ